MSRPQTYLLHFSEKIGNPSNRRAMAGHYVGTTDDLARRLRQHQLGVGSAITRAAVERGVVLFVARTWPGGRVVEKRIKGRKNAPKLCPACVPAPWELPEVDELEQAADEAAELELERVLEDAHFGGEVTP
jgi:hypothetical protein